MNVITKIETFWKTGLRQLEKRRKTIKFLKDMGFLCAPGLWIVRENYAYRSDTQPPDTFLATKVGIANKYKRFPVSVLVFLLGTYYRIPTELEVLGRCSLVPGPASVVFLSHHGLVKLFLSHRKELWSVYANSNEAERQFRLQREASKFLPISSGRLLTVYDITIIREPWIEGAAFSELGYENRIHALESIIDLYQRSESDGTSVPEIYGIELELDGCTLSPLGCLYASQLNEKPHIRGKLSKVTFIHGDLIARNILVADDCQIHFIDTDTLTTGCWTQDVFRLVMTEAFAGRTDLLDWICSDNVQSLSSNSYPEDMHPAFILIAGLYNFVNLLGSSDVRLKDSFYMQKNVTKVLRFLQAYGLLNE